MNSLWFGIVQGLTEFLPVSSDGHLYFLQNLLAVREDLLAFFVFLHMATLLVIFIFFASQIKNFFLDRRLLGYVVAVTVISGTVALVMKIFLSHYFVNRYFLIVGFFLNAFIVLNATADKPLRGMRDLNTRDVILFGLFQGLAVLPAISRSGITICCLLKRGFKRDEAFTLSFLMGIPVILLAVITELPELSGLAVSGVSIWNGFIAAFICGFIALMIVRKMVITDRFKYFGYYCLLLSVASIFLKG